MKEEKALGPINPIVDFYNAVSIKYGVTAGAFDLGELQRRSILPLELRLSTKDDTFTPLGSILSEGEQPAVHVSEGEVVYVQGGTVLTRHLAWRQGAEALVTKETRDVIFMCEVFHDDGKEEIGDRVTELTRSVVEEFVNGLKLFFGVEARVAVLGEGIGLRSVEVENAFF